MGKREKAPPPSVLGRVRASGYLDTSFDGKEVHPLAIRPLTKEEAFTEYRNSGGKTSWVCDKLEEGMPYSVIRTKALGVMVLNFRRDIESNEALAEMDMLGVRPLIYEELVQYGILYPEHQKRKYLVGLGTKYPLSGNLQVPFLGFDGVGCGVTAGQWSGGWNSDECRFLVVCK